MFDLNVSDGVEHTSIVDLQSNEQIIDRQELEMIEETITRQYIDFENLGANLLTSVPLKYKMPIFERMLIHINENYTAITNMDQALASPNKMIEVGDLVYRFFVIDCFYTFVPNYLNKINCINVEQFRQYFQKTLKNDINSFKADFIKIIKTVVDQLLNLQKLDRTANENKDYRQLLRRNGYYMELINFGDSSNFVFNYFEVMLLKNESEIIGRLT